MEGQIGYRLRQLAQGGCNANPDMTPTVPQQTGCDLDYVASVVVADPHPKFCACGMSDCWLLSLGAPIRKAPLPHSVVGLAEPCGGIVRRVHAQAVTSSFLPM